MKFVHNLILTLSLVLRVQHCNCSPPAFVSYCECPYSHPQTLLCRADVVVKIKILKAIDLHQFYGNDPWGFEAYETINGTTEYVKDIFEAKILKVYKRKKEFTTKKVNISVFPVEDFGYGCPPTDFVDSEGDVFVIGGTEYNDGIELEGCKDFHEKFTKLTTSQRKLLRKRKYWSANACQCNICYEGDVFFESYSFYDKVLTTKSCTESTKRCIYNVNEERNEERVNAQGLNGFEFGGCFQGNAYCQYNAKKNKCQWKFHRLGKKAEECEDILNKE